MMLPAGVLVLALAAGCAEPRAPLEGMLAAFDSVPTVLNDGVRPAAWRVEEEPALVIGTGDRRDPLLEGPLSVIVAGEDIVIGDGGSHLLYVIGADGAVEFALGGHGIRRRAPRTGARAPWARDWRY